METRANWILSFHTLFIFVRQLPKELVRFLRDWQEPLWHRRCSWSSCLWVGRRRAGYSLYFLKRKGAPRSLRLFDPTLPKYLRWLPCGLFLISPRFLSYSHTQFELLFKLLFKSFYLRFLNPFIDCPYEPHNNKPTRYTKNA